jgi:hypothetical protein
MLTFVHVSHTDNTGDLMSSPRHWFVWPSETRAVDFRTVRGPLPGPVIAGGGALTFWILRGGLYDSPGPKIAWGVGTTLHGETEPLPDPPEGEGYFDLVGVREWSAAREAAGRWAPCASCMSALFDDPPAPTRPTVRFLNADPNIRRKYPLGFDHLPTMYNTEPMAEIVAFLASAETVVTDSYHGVYWATLLGRGVVCQPYSSKFHGFRHPPAMIAPGAEALPRVGINYPHALAECRAATWAFYHRVQDVLAGVVA